MERREATRPAVRELLCDRCGYSLEGTPDTPVCSECGLDFAASRAMRVGSPWQRRPSFRGWLATVVGVILRPRWTMRTLSINEDNNAYPLFICNVTVIPVVVLMLTGVGIAIAAQRDASVTLEAMIAFPLTWTVLTLACLVVWFPATTAMFGLGVLMLRAVKPGSPVVRLGGMTIASHASCVLVPTGAALVAFTFALGPIWALTLLLVPCFGFAWFLFVCLLGTACPDRAPPAHGR